MSYFIWVSQNVIFRHCLIPKSDCDSFDFSGFLNYETAVRVVKKTIAVRPPDLTTIRGQRKIRDECDLSVFEEFSRLPSVMFFETARRTTQCTVKQYTCKYFIASTCEYGDAITRPSENDRRETGPYAPIASVFARYTISLLFFFSPRPCHFLRHSSVSETGSASLNLTTNKPRRGSLRFRKCR